MLHLLASCLNRFILNSDRQHYLVLPLNKEKQKEEYTPTPNSSVTAGKWIAQAERKLQGVSLAGNYLLSPLARNQRITQLYAALYSCDPQQRFGWAGLAAFGSATVGDALKIATWLSQLNLPQALTSDFHQMAGLLASANKAIYSDIYWQHLAYLSDGIRELETVYREGGISQQMWENWQLLYQGQLANDRHLLNLAAKLFLRYEQQVIAQPLIYQDKRALWNKALFLRNISFMMPGNCSRFRAYMFTRRTGSQFSFADFDDRWQWLEEVIVPAWESITATNPVLVEKELKKLYWQPLPYLGSASFTNGWSGSATRHWRTP